MYSFKVELLIIMCSDGNILIPVAVCCKDGKRYLYVFYMYTVVNDYLKKS